MADVYLTKIERKTIFTRALIYVLILFVVADLTVTGPFFVNFIPWLYVLGVITSIRGVDKALTGIIGTFTVFVSSLITKGGINMDSLLYTLNAVIQLGLGMLSAHIIHQFVLDHRMVKYIKPKKKVNLSVFFALFTILSLVVSSIVHGDLYSYLKSKSNLNEYVTNVYNVEYEIKEVTYNRNLPGRYTYVVIVDGEQVHFVPVLPDAFKDANQEQRLKLKNININAKLREKLAANLTDMNILTTDSFEFKYEYTKVGIIPDSLSAYVTVNTEDAGIYNELSSSIIKMLEIEPNITEIDIVLNGKTLHITKQKFNLITPEYIEGGFKIEDLDE